MLSVSTKSTDRTVHEVRKFTNLHSIMQFEIVRQTLMQLARHCAAALAHETVQFLTSHQTLSHHISSNIVFYCSLWACVCMCDRFNPVLLLKHN